jgi:POT family proton-dependent oligopeptide transporter
MMSSMISDSSGGNNAGSQRQPPALFMLFSNEVWERVSFYGIRALLVLYLVNALGYEPANAAAIYASSIGLMYFSPLVGGYLADRYLGRRKAILIGGFTMALGHFAMALPPPGSDCVSDWPSSYSGRTNWAMRA